MLGCGVELGGDVGEGVKLGETPASLDNYRAAPANSASCGRQLITLYLRQQEIILPAAAA